MRPRIDPSQALRSLADGQAGVVSLRQATELGLPSDCVRRLIDQGHWQRVTPGIFHLGSGEPSWLARAWTGILLGGQHARLGYAAAGHLWGLVEAPPAEIAVLVPAGRQVRRRAGWTFPREGTGVRVARSRAEPPRTAQADTVVDLCTGTDEAEVVDLITQAVQRHLVTAPELLRCVQGRRRLVNRATMLALLGEVAEGAESPLELRYLQDVERPHGLPTAKRQQRSRSGRAVRDALYEEYATIVELDGQVHERRRLRDMRRDNGALLEGLVSLRYGWPEVAGSPCQVAWQVAAVLVQRGWTGLPTRWAGGARTPPTPIFGSTDGRFVEQRVGPPGEFTRELHSLSARRSSGRRISPSSMALRCSPRRGSGSPRAPPDRSGPFR